MPRSNNAPRPGGSADGRDLVQTMLPRYELPTWLLAAVIYGGWLATTYAFDRLPLVLALPLGAWLIAWHSSLQHETIHGHPTRAAALNAALGWLPLGLWLPYGIYREQHLAHHADQQLTDPLSDPESFYVHRRSWREANRARRAVLQLNQTLLGRLIAGPAIALARLIAGEVRHLRRGQLDHLRYWAAHLALAVPVLLWVTVVCDIAPSTYLLCFVLPGTSLTLLRSFAEHRPASDPAHRTVIVDSSRLLGLLFLYNNLHAVHHRLPQASWFRLPGLYRQSRGAILEANGGYHFRGYREIARRFAVRAKDDPVWPMSRG